MVPPEGQLLLSHFMKLWYFSSSINPFFKGACTASRGKIVHLFEPWLAKMSGARCLIFGRTLCLLPYFMCANSEGSSETAQMRRLFWTFAGCLCDKHHNHMSWLEGFMFTGFSTCVVMKVVTGKAKSRLVHSSRSASCRGIEDDN